MASLPEERPQFLLHRITDTKFRCLSQAEEVREEKGDEYLALELDSKGQHRV